MSKIQCLYCMDIIESKSLHDFRYCFCKKVYIDGGDECPRIGAPDLEMVREIPDELNKKDKERDRRLFKTYGITLLDFNKLLQKQAGCAICHRKDGRLCVDHIHVKGFKLLSAENKRKYVRGILCFICNTALKGFERTNDGRRNRNQFMNTIKYFETYSLKGEL